MYEFIELEEIQMKGVMVGRKRKVSVNVNEIYSLTPGHGSDGCQIETKRGTIYTSESYDLVNTLIKKLGITA
jgi:hypothetical protein